MTDLGPEAHLGPWADGQQSNYAMGWFVGGPWGADAVFHPGNTPDTTTMLAVLPEQDAAVAVVVSAGNELPLPGNPNVTDRITRAVLHDALEQSPSDVPSLTRYYLVFDIVALLLTLAAAWAAWRAVRSLRTSAPVVHPVRGWLAVAARLAAAGVLVVLPLLSYGWLGLWTWAPDVAIVFAALAGLLVLTAGLRLVWLLRAPRGRSASTDDPPHLASMAGALSPGSSFGVDN
jgi:hypothetical protein